MPTNQEVRQQSESAYNQWCEQWRKQAKEHSKYKMHSLDRFKNTGIGKALLLIATGRSFQRKIDIIKENQDHVDIMVNDKSLGPCLEAGIKPKYVVVADANVSYEQYCEPYKDELSDVILFSNVCANPKWASGANWKEMYFYVNRDVLGSEREFMELSKCPNHIPASTNVSNTMVVLATLCDNSRRQNFFGYDKYILIGYDYSWQHGGYYAFSDNGGGKEYYMKHMYIKDMSGAFAYTSNNLLFSSRWLAEYIKAHNLPVINCSETTILEAKNSNDLKSQMLYNFKREDKNRVNLLVKNRSDLMKKLAKIEETLKDINQEHQFNFLATI